MFLINLSYWPYFSILFPDKEFCNIVVNILNEIQWWWSLWFIFYLIEIEIKHVNGEFILNQLTSKNPNFRFMSRQNWRGLILQKTI